VLLQDLIVDESEPLPTELDMRRREVAVLREARAWGLGREPGPPEPDLHLPARLQRHGVPTRLLDVTHNPMTALWFACEGGDEAGVLLAVDVTDVPTYDPVGSPADPLDRSLRCALAVSARTGAPFLVRPAVQDARTRAQEGLYLSGAVPAVPALSGVDGLPLPFGEAPGSARLASLFAPEERGAGRPARLPFCAVVIPARIKRKVKDHLTALNRRRSTVYPDVDGFREALRDGEVALHPLPDVVPAAEDTAALGG